MIAIMSTDHASLLRDLRCDPLIATLDEALLSTARARQAEAGEVLFRAGEKPSRIYYVGDGEAVMQRTTPAGASVILQRATRAFLAEASLTSEHYHCDGICRTRCELLVFPVRAIRDAIDTHHAARWAWIGMLATQSRQQRTRIERMSLKTVRERLHHLVLTEGTAEGSYTLPGTRLQLAAELGVTPEALYRTLAALQAEGVVTSDGARLTWLE